MPRKKGTPKTGGRKKGRKNRQTMKFECSAILAHSVLYDTRRYDAIVKQFRLLESYDGHRILIEAHRMVAISIANKEAEVELLKLEEQIAANELADALKEAGERSRHLELVH